MAIVEKCNSQLPAMRVPERLELALMRLAAADARALSDYVRMVLERHCYGHAPSIGDDGAAVTQCNAVHCSALQRNAVHVGQGQ